jgi:hypothetical protein
MEIPEEMRKYITKFELPETEGLKHSIENIKSSDRWLLKDRDIRVFDAIEHKLVSMMVIFQNVLHIVVIYH